MSCSCAGDLANIYSAIGNLEGQFNYITGNTMTNYNQLSRIVSQQSNIYNTIYYGLGNMSTGNLIINNSYLINGNLSLPTGNLIVSSGNILSTIGNIIMNNGNIGLINGNLILSNGNIGITRGNLIVSNGNILSTIGNIVINNGNIGITRGNLILSNGNIGINITNPRYAFDMVGDANITGAINTSLKVYESNKEIASIGVNQVWTNQLSVRVINGIYQNNTGRPIVINFTMYGNTAGATLTIFAFEVSLNSDMTSAIEIGREYTYSDEHGVTLLGLIIPDTYYYRFRRVSGTSTTGTAQFQLWSELGR